MDNKPSPSTPGISGSRYTVVKAIVVRCLLLVHSSVAVWVVVLLRDEQHLYALLATNVLLVLETLHSVVTRRGRERKWFCPCLLAYLCAIVPPIWLVELHRVDLFEQNIVARDFETPQLKGGMKISFKLGKDVLVAVIEQTLLLVLVLCRWALPRGDITRQELSQLLFLFLSIGSDIMQLFELFNQKAVRNDPTLTYITLGVWSVSLLQLTIVLTATRTPSRARVDHVPQPARLSRNNPKGDGRGPKKQPLTQMIFTTEIWSLALGVLVQDGPYAAIRIYTMVKHNLITYSIIFFVSKNVLVICLACYRLVALCLDKPTEHDTIDGDGHTRDARSSAMFVTSSVTHGRDNMGNTFRA